MVQIWFMILRHFKFSLTDTLIICFMKHKKPLYMTSRARSVQSKITLLTSLVTPIRGFRHFPWINLIQLFICSVYEYGPLQNYVISKLLRRHVLLFPKYSSNWCYGSQALKFVDQITSKLILYVSCLFRSTN